MKSDSEKCCVYHKWYILIEESALCGIDESERECVMNANWERECNTLRLRTEREKERENAMLWYNERRISLKNLDRQAEWETTHRNSSPPFNDCKWSLESVIIQNEIKWV